MKQFDFKRLSEETRRKISEHFNYDVQEDDNAYVALVHLAWAFANGHVISYWQVKDDVDLNVDDYDEDGINLYYTRSQYELEKIEPLLIEQLEDSI